MLFKRNDDEKYTINEPRYYKVVDYDRYIDQNYREGEMLLPVKIIYPDDHLYKRINTRYMIFKLLTKQTRIVSRIFKKLNLNSHPPIRGENEERDALENAITQGINNLLDNLIDDETRYILEHFDFFRTYANLKRLEKHLVKYNECLLINVSSCQELYYKTKQTHSTKEADIFELGFSVPVFSIESASGRSVPLVVGETVNVLRGGGENHLSKIRIEVSKKGMSLALGNELNENGTIKLFSQLPIRPGRVIVVMNN